MIKIPSQLQNKNFRFHILPEYEKVWYSKPNIDNYRFDSPEIVKAISENKNIAMVLGYGSSEEGYPICLDLDSDEAIEDTKGFNLNRTYTQLSAFRKKPQMFFLCRNLKSSKHFYVGQKPYVKNYFDIVGINNYVPIAGSIIKKDGKLYTYEIKEPSELCFISDELFNEFVKLGEEWKCKQKPESKKITEDIIIKSYLTPNSRYIDKKLFRKPVKCKYLKVDGVISDRVQFVIELPNGEIGYFDLFDTEETKLIEITKSESEFMLYSTPFRKNGFTRYSLRIYRFKKNDDKSLDRFVITDKQGERTEL